MEPRFLIARNPDPESSMPYLLRLPIGDDGLVLKARETWPRTAKVYCHRAPGEWPDAPEIVEAVGVEICQRRGVAIDLVLARGREKRSQFVFTRLKGGREAIFWQTSRTLRTGRPGVRIPGRRASWLSDLVITIDTRERYAYKFTAQQAETERAALPVGDYGVRSGDEVLAVVERKSLADLAKGLTDGSLFLLMADLARLDRAAVVVEDRYSALFRHEYVSGGVLADAVARAQVRYPAVPIVFCETRRLAEEWTFRFLGAALAYHHEKPSDPTAPRLWVD
jgi:hypothetical protein